MLIIFLILSPVLLTVGYILGAAMTRASTESEKVQDRLKRI